MTQTAIQPPTQRMVGVAVLQARFHKEGDQWLGECSELGTATFGDSLEEVQAELRELIELHLDALGRSGERDRFFAEHGVRFSPVVGAVPEQVMGEIPILTASPSTELSVPLAVPVYPAYPA